MVAGDGDTVVSVQYEVGISYLVQAHRRKVNTSVERQIHALPPIARVRAKRSEAPVEVPAASHAPDDLLWIDDLYPLADRVVRSERPSDLVEGDRCVVRRAFSSQAHHQSPQRCLASRPAEVPVDLLVKIHQKHPSTPLF